MAFADQALSLPAPDSRTFRDALGRFATGVAFITAAVDGEPTGLIVNPLTSVSLNPPLVAFTPLAHHSRGAECAGRDASE